MIFICSLLNLLRPDINLLGCFFFTDLYFQKFYYPELQENDENKIFV